MRKLLLLLALITAPALAWANQSARGWCELGGQVVVTSGLNSTTTVQASYPACTVTVNVFGGGLATIFSDNVGTPLANPFTATSAGQWTFFAANGHYTVMLSGGGLPSPVTLSDILLNDPTGPTSFTGTFFSTASAQPAQSGVFRLASADIGLCWRNNANTADICFTKDSGDVVHLNTSLTLAGLTSSAEAAPSATGVALGDATHRWDAFIRNLDVSGIITGILSGSGATNTIPKFTATTVIGNSSVTDDGTTVTTTEPIAAPKVTSGNVNNHIYLGTTAYPNTQAGLQSALTDACSLLNGNGTDITLPPAATITATAAVGGALWTSTCPVRIHGSTMGSSWLVVGAGIASTVPTFLIRPSAANLGYWEFDHVRGTTAALGQTGGDWIFLDTTLGDVSDLMVHDSSFQGQCKASGSASCDPALSAWFINMNTAGGANHVFLGDIENNNTIEGGINCNGECSDSWRVVHNSFGSPNGNTNPCMNATTFNNGTAMFTADNNNGGCAGGFFISHGTLQCLIINNQIEQPAASTEANSAIIDLIGDTYQITDCKIRDNNIGSNNLANINVRVNNAIRTTLSGNVIGPNTTAGVGVALTGSSGTTHMDVNGSNTFVLGGTAVAMTNASGVNPFTVILPTSTGTLPATIKNDSAGGIQLLTNGNKSWDFQNTSNLVAPVGVGITLPGATSGNAILAASAVAGGTHTFTANGGNITEVMGTPVDITGQSAATGTLTAFAVVNAGQYLISWNSKITTAATTSSTLGPMTLSWTDPDGVVLTTLVSASQPAGGITTSGVASNTTSTFLIGTPLMLNCKAGTNITYSFAYASTGATAMQYNLHLRVTAQ